MWWTNLSKILELHGRDCAPKSRMLGIIVRLRWTNKFSSTDSLEYNGMTGECELTFFHGAYCLSMLNLYGLWVSNSIIFIACGVGNLGFHLVKSRTTWQSVMSDMCRHSTVHEACNVSMVLPRSFFGVDNVFLLHSKA